MLDELYVIDKIILVKSSNVGKMLKFATTLRQPGRSGIK